MKRLTATLLVGLLTSSLIFTGCGKKESSKRKQETKEEINKDPIPCLTSGDETAETREDANGWNESTNIPVKTNNLTIQLPSYAKEEQNGLYRFEGEGDGDTVNLVVRTIDDAMIYIPYSNDYGVSDNSIKTFCSSFLPSLANDIGATYTSDYTKTTVGPYTAIKFGFKGENFDAPMTIIFDGDYETTIGIMLMQRNGSLQNFKSDYQKIVSNIGYEEPTITANTKNICDAYVEAMLNGPYDRTINQSMMDLINKVPTLPSPDKHYVWEASDKVSETQRAN